MKLEVQCDTCGRTGTGDEIRFLSYLGTDLCNGCRLKQELAEAKREYEHLKSWLESTHLKKLTELEERIRAIEEAMKGG